MRQPVAVFLDVQLRLLYVLSQTSDWSSRTQETSRNFQKYDWWILSQLEVPVACYLYVALQRLLQNKNNSGAQREPHFCGEGQTPQLTKNGDGSPGLLKEDKDTTTS